MKKVLLFLPRGFEAYEASVFTDVTGWSNSYGIEPVEAVTAGLREEIPATWNFIVRPQMALESVDTGQFDALAVPGGFESAGFYEDAFDERFLSIIRDFDRNKKPVASVCVGALPLGKAGILKDRKATTYDLPDGSRRRQLAQYGVIVQDQNMVVDQNVITSTGPATGLDVAFTLLEMLTSKSNVQAVREQMRFR